MTERQIHNRCSVLNRTACVEILIAIAIHCADDEPIEDLREAVAANVLDGTIEQNTLWNYSEALAQASSVRVRELDW